MPADSQNFADVVIATHHKAGSTYARKCFSELSAILKFKLVVLGHGERPCNQDIPKDQNCFILLTHSRLSDIKLALQLLGSKNHRIVHVIRDPRTLIISGCQYHRKANEEWLKLPSTRFHGQSYQSAITACSTQQEQLIFEMRNGAMPAIKNMLEIHGSGLATIEISLEELSWDRSQDTHKRLSQHLFGQSTQADHCYSVLLKNSLFSMMQLPAHCTTQVQPYLGLELYGKAAEIYHQLYGDAHKILGYP